jgi:hypothetical protein
MPIDSSYKLEKIQPAVVSESLDSLDKKTVTPKNTTVFLVQEFGGFSGPEPTRFGDWEKNGRCVDF